MLPPALEPTLKVTFRREAGALHLCVEGELDRQNAWVLTAAVMRLPPSSAAQLVLDLEGLAFIDAGGLRALADVARRTRRQGRALPLSHAPEYTLRLIRLTRLERLFEVR